MRLRKTVICWCLLSCGAEVPQAQAPSPPPPPPLPAPVPASSGAAAKLEPNPTPAPPESRMQSFEADVEFLAQHGAKPRVLESGSGGRVVISGTYQGRVMTSAVEPRGASLGFVNRSFIEAGKTGTAFDNYGGEDRFWLGPEGGQYALYFAPGKAFQFDNWQTPHGFQEGAWREQPSTASSAVFEQSLSLVNYAGTELKLDVRRQITLLGSEQVEAALGLAIPSDVKWVAFKSDNTITNRGAAWSEAKGIPSIWILGLFNPAPGTRIIAPFETIVAGDVVNDRYFGKIPADRLLVDRDKGFVLLKADGQARGKIGLSPARAKPVLGSYSAEGKTLTLVRFSKPAGAKRYVNNLWEVSKEPYGGDVSNAYNDGPVEPGKPSLGGFYELESSSPAVPLKTGQSLTHSHETYHLIGPESALAEVARRALGVNLADVTGAKL